MNAKYIICVKYEECKLTNKPNEYLQCTEFVRNKTCRDDGNESIVEESVPEDSEGFTKERIECMTGRFVQINHEKYYSGEKTLSKKKFFESLLPHDDKPLREPDFFPNTFRSQQSDRRRFRNCGSMIAHAPTGAHAPPKSQARLRWQATLPDLLRHAH